jgi:tetratricopeptide (TPR) repeat protein
MGKAREVFASGVRAYEERRYKDAIDLFQEANRITANPAFSFNIGIAYEDMGDPAMALRHYRDYLRQLPAAADADAVEERTERIEEILAAKGVQQVSVLSDPPGARLSIDGKAIGVTPWTGEIAPGHHQVTLELAGYRTETRDFDLPRRSSIDVPVTLTAQRPVPMVAPTPAPVSTRVESGALTRIRPETWVIFGSGVASLGVSLGFELSRSALEERARKEPVQVPSAQFLDQAHDRATWARGFLMLGSGLTLTSLVLAYLNLDEPRANVALACTPTGCGLGMAGRF